MSNDNKSISISVESLTPADVKSILEEQLSSDDFSLTVVSKPKAGRTGGSEFLDMIFKSGITHGVIANYLTRIIDFCVKHLSKRFGNSDTKTVIKLTNGIVAEIPNKNKTLLKKAVSSILSLGEIESMDIQR